MVLCITKLHVTLSLPPWGRLGGGFYFFETMLRYLSKAASHWALSVGS